MKKVLIILSVAIMLIASVSCEKDKSGEMVETYEEFMTALAKCNLATISNGYDEATNECTISESYLQEAVNKINDSEITITSGDAKFVRTEKTEGQKTTFTYDNVSIKYKYTEGSDETPKDGTLTISGSYSITDYSTRALARDTEYSYDLTVNGKSYKLSYYLNADRTYKSASVNGKNVELRLLNAPATMAY